MATAAAAFFVVTSLTIAWSRFGGGLALLWPGTAILVALLVSLPRPRWLATVALFAILSTIATASFGFGPRVAFPLALVNTMEAYAIAALMIHLRPQRDWLESVPGLERMLAAVIVGTGIASVPGGLMAMWAVSGQWEAHILDWISGHVLGSLLCLPLALMVWSGVMSDKIRRASPRTALECAAHCAMIAAVSWVAFFQSALALLFLPTLPLMYAAFRRGRVGAMLGLLVIAVFGAVSLHVEVGYFHNLDVDFVTGVQIFQFYLATLLLLALPTSVALKRHKLLVAELQEKRALKRLVADHSDDALLNLDAQGLIRYASPAGDRLSPADEAVGLSLVDFFDPLDEIHVRSTLLQAAETPGITRVFERSVIRGEETLWLETKLRAVPAAEGGAGIMGYAVTMHDVTARKLAELDARREAETDQLTGLPNRRAFLRHLEPRLEHAAHRPVALAIIDLDHFKRVNDRFGHTTGDTTLRLVADTMRRISAPGIFFARLGGEEFALVAEKLSAAEAVALCEEVRQAIGRLRPASPDGVHFGCTASVGVAILDRDMVAADALRAADAPLYAAKAAGRNRVEIAAPRTAERRDLRAARAA
ncbi:diguanylate cyclase domain-containing protein [Qipengyuania sp.]|uniref:sensor domain-containing diguanylate cyclase n=1 Tax=Qipengyuania sp. TaxID=2004515 RepID=UPI0035C78F73